MIAPAQTRVVTEAHLEPLPAPIQRYLRYTGIVGYPWIDTVRLTYSGQFRLGLDKPWMPIHASQTYTTQPPAFEWKARFRMFGLPLMYGQDTYQGGEGHMFGKLAGAFTVFDARDEKLLQGTMMRYLQEASWFPTAYLTEYFTWKAVDDHAADGTFSYCGKQVTGRFFIDDEGRLLTFIARRYREHKGSYTFDTWATPTTEYGRFNGLRLPIAGCGLWQLEDGDLPYVMTRLTDIAYNQPLPS